MEIINCGIKDLPMILGLYEAATALQITKSVVPWPKFESNLIKTEIMANRQWKIIINEQIACTWTVTFSDHRFGKNETRTLRFISIA
jgi:hypothetical protein